MDASWRERLGSEHAPLQQGAVWSYLSQMPSLQEDGQGSDRTGKEAWKAYRHECLQNASPVVVECAVWGLIWLVEAHRISLSHAWTTLSQEWPHIPACVVPTALQVFDDLATRMASSSPSDAQENREEMWVRLVRARPSSVGPLLSFWESQDTQRLYGADASAWASWAALLAYLIEQNHSSSTGPWRSLVVSSLHRAMNALSYLEAGVGQDTCQGEAERTAAAHRLFCFLAARVPQLPLRDALDLHYQVDYLLQLGAWSQHAYQADLISSSDALDIAGSLFSHLLSVWADLYDRPLTDPSSLGEGETNRTTPQASRNSKNPQRGRQDASPILQAAQHMLGWLQSMEDWEGYVLRSHEQQRNVLLLAFLLLRSHEGQQLMVLRLLDGLLFPSLASDAYCRLFVLPRLVYPLLHVMGSPTGRTKSLASQLLFRVERLLGSAWKDTSPGEQETKEQGNSPVVVVPIVTSGLSMQLAYLVEEWAALYADALHSPSRDVVTMIQTHLERVRETLHESMLNDFFLFWNVAFLFHGSVAVRQALCECLERMVLCSAERSVGLLSLLLYQSEKEHDGQVQLTLMHITAALAKHTPLLPTVFRTFHAIVQVSGMEGVGVRLLCRLWQAQDRAFRKFQSTLLSLYERRQQLDAQVLMAVALCVRDVCKTRPARGMEFISLISELIQVSGQPAVKSLGLQALTHLCAADCVEFSTAWTIIEKDVLADTHPLVLEQRMNLLEGGVDELDLESPATAQHLQLLWEGTQHSAAPIRQAAYRVLQVFFEQEGACMTWQRSRADYLPLLFDPSDVSAPAALRLIQTVVQEEVGQSRRQIEVATQGNALYSQLARQVEHIEEAYVEAKRPTLTAGLAGGNLWSFQPTGKKQASSARGESMVLARSYHVRLTELLQDVFMSSWATRVVGLSAWLRFSSKCFTVRIQSEKAKQEEAGESAQGDGPLYTDAMQKMRGLLAEKRTISPATAENCVMALVGCTLALPVSKHDLIEESVEALLLQWADPDKTSNERERFACLLGLACLTHALTLTDLPRIREIWQLLRDEMSGEEWNHFGACLGAGLMARALLHKAKGLSETHAGPATALSTEIRERLEQEVARELPLETKSIALLGAYLGLAHVASAETIPQELARMKTQNDQRLEQVKHAPRSIAMSGACLLHASIALRMFRLNTLSAHAMEETLLQMKAWAFPLASAQGNLGACIALGTLVQGALLYGLSWPSKELDAVMSSYITLLASTQLSDSVREACLLGVANVLGAGLVVPMDGTLDLVDSSESLYGALSHVNDPVWMDPLFRTLHDTLHQPQQSNRLASFCAWILGSLGRALPSHNHHAATTDALLQQLSEDSLLKALVQQLDEMANSTREMDSGMRTLRTQRLLATLCQVPAAKLPSIDWSPLVQPWLKAGVDLSLRLAAFRFVLHNATNSSLSHLLSCTMEVADYQQLPPSIQLLLWEHMPTLMATLPAKRATRLLHEHAMLLQENWRAYLDRPTPSPLTIWWPMLTTVLGDPHLSSTVRETALLELQAFLTLMPWPMREDPSRSQGWQIDESLSTLYWQVGSCLRSLGDKLLEQCLSSLESQSEGAVKHFLLVCVLVRQGRYGLEQLVAQRSFCFTYPQVDQASVMALWMSEALREVNDRPIRQRWYQDCLDCALVMPHPRVVFRFLACLALTWATPELESLLHVRFDWEKGWYPRHSAIVALDRLLPMLLPRLLASWAALDPLPDTFLAKQRAWYHQQAPALAPGVAHHPTPSQLLSLVLLHIQRTLPTS